MEEIRIREKPIEINGKYYYICGYCSHFKPFDECLVPIDDVYISPGGYPYHGQCCFIMFTED